MRLALDSPLDCGCPSGGVIYGCIHCRDTRCPEHREQPHTCPTCPGCGIRHGLPLHEPQGYWATVAKEADA